MGQTNARDRALETARELRAAAEEARRTIQASRDIVRRSREQTLAILTPPETEPQAEPRDPCLDQSPSDTLVRCLIQAYEHAIDDGDVRSQALLGPVLHDVGCRVAASIGPKAAHVILH